MTDVAELNVPALVPDAPVSPQAPLFADLGVNPEIVAALVGAGITRAFAIQEMTLPIALAGNDLIGQARTGTGKTLGFGIPLLQRITAPTDPAADTVGSLPQALVIVPTRELCVQVTRDLGVAGAARGLRVQPVYGGRAYEPQIEGLRRGADVIVGTPGRLMDLAKQGHLKLGEIEILVLDEADEMLDLGFLPDIERILTMLPDATRHPRQTMLFSATMPDPIVTLARRFMSRPVHIRAETAGESHTVPATDQHVYRAHPMDKIEVLARILQADERGLTMVFCRTKRTAQKVSDELATRGFASAAIHGDLGQGAREQGLRAFRSGKVDVLVATDVAARGIDVSGVTHVINYQCPEDEKNYVHRIGRTGRAGASGTAVTFVDWDELPRWQLINKALGLPFPEPVETYSTSEHLRQELNIPAHAGGTLPRRDRVRAGLAAETNDEPTRGTADKPGQRRGRGGGRSRTHDGQARPGGDRDSSRGSVSEREKRETGSRNRRRTRGGKPTEVGN